VWQVDFFLNEPMKCKRTQAFQGFNPKSIILMNTGLKIPTNFFLFATKNVHGGCKVATSSSTCK